METQFLKKNFFYTFYAGFFAGIAGPVAGFFIYYFVFRYERTLAAFWKITLQPLNTPKVMALSVIANLLLFFLFIRLKLERGARGVMMGTLPWVAAIIYFKFFA